MLCPAGVLGPAPGVKAQAAHSHGLVLSFFGALRFNEDGLRALLVVRQGGQQSGSDAAGPILGQNGKVVQLAHLTAHGPHHQQIRHQRVVLIHAPGVGGTGSLAVQDHAQGLQLSGRKIPAHLVQVNVRQLFGGQQPPGQVLGVHTIRVPFW